MLEDLLRIKKISLEEYQSYMVFKSSEIGRQWLDRMFDFAFMDVPPAPDLTTVLLAYCEGRRAILREIRSNILTVEKALEEAMND